jgi:tetratricopeptide (TPR) repeat protein
MSLQTLDHEEKILRDIKDRRVVSLERALLVLSGIETKKDIQSYVNKIDDIFKRFLTKCDNIIIAEQLEFPLYLHLEIAKRLFEYLWNSKPKRFGESFLLADVVDAQLNSNLNHLIGTCVGLTSLYSVLGLRAGLNLSLLVSSDHLLSRLWVGKETIDIDHTDPQGFGCANCEGFREFPLVTLIANVFNSRGLNNERNGRFAGARSDYQKAMRVNPEYANACNNRGNMRFWDKDLEGAIADYTEAIRLCPGFCEAYCNRGLAKQELGRYEEARQDFSMALSTRPEYSDALRCLQLLDDIAPTWEKDHNIRFPLT